MGFSTTLQLFDFSKAKDNFEDANANARINLYTFKNFIDLIIEESSAVKERLKATDFNATDLLGYDALDIIFEFYKNSIELKQGSDFTNMKKIACKILGINELTGQKKERLGLLFICLYPWQLVDPNPKEEGLRNKIKNEVDKIAKYEVDLLEEELKQCQEEEINIGSNINKCKSSLDRAQEDLETIQEEIGRKEREIRTPKKKVESIEKDEFENITKDEDDKENKRRENTDSEDSVDDDPMELLQKSNNA